MGGGKWKTCMLLITLLPPTNLYRHVKEARQIAASDGFSKKRGRSQTSGPLTMLDSANNPFNVGTATSYCEKGPYSMLSRDVIVYTKDADGALKFLVKPWEPNVVEKTATHGNPFGIIVYSPPTDIPRTTPPEDYETFMWAPKPGCWLITFRAEGNPNWERFKKVMADSAPNPMEAADALDTMAVVRPAFGEERRASAMTTLVSFMEVTEGAVKMEDSDLKLEWISLEQALDEAVNFHAPLIAKFLQSPDQKTGVLPPEGLEKYDSTLVLPLIPGLRQFGGWLPDPALMQYTMKALLWANGIEEPAPRTCDPAAADAPPVPINASVPEGVVGMGEAGEGAAA